MMSNAVVAPLASPNLSPAALSRVLARPSAEWQARYGHPIFLVETLVDPECFQGTVDRARLAVGGHSDGASYALSFGIGAGHRFDHVLAFSPGVLAPVDVQGKPRIFISHGTDDRVMPIDDTSRRFVPRLRGLGYDVTYREYAGRHAVPDGVVSKAFAWAYGAPAAPLR